MSALSFVLAVWVAQAAANVALRFGAVHPRHHLLGYVVGCSVTLTGMWFIMKTHQHLDAPLTIALCGGGGFLVAQLALAVVFRSTPSWIQLVGIAIIAGGIALTAMGSRPAPSGDRGPEDSVNPAAKGRRSGDRLLAQHGSVSP